MNTLKVQTELLKVWAKGKRNHCRYAPEPGGDGERIAVTSDGFVVHVLDRAECLIDLDKLGEPMPVLWRFLSGLKDYTLLGPTGVEVLQDCGRRVAEYNGACGMVYLDPKLLTCFDKGAQLYGRSATEAVIVMEADAIVGCVMPVRHNEETNKNG